MPSRIVLDTNISLFNFFQVGGIGKSIYACQVELLGALSEPKKCIERLWVWMCILCMDTCIDVHNHFLMYTFPKHFQCHICVVSISVFLQKLDFQKKNWIDLVSVFLQLQVPLKY